MYYVLSTGKEHCRVGLIQLTSGYTVFLVLEYNGGHQCGNTPCSFRETTLCGMQHSMTSRFPTLVVLENTWLEASVKWSVLNSIHERCGERLNQLRSSFIKLLVFEYTHGGLR